VKAVALDVCSGREVQALFLWVAVTLREALLADRRKLGFHCMDEAIN